MVRDGSRQGLQGLTEREREVLALIARGLSTKEIAASLDIGQRTVETHRANLMRKLGVKSVALLTQVAIREGIVPIPPAHVELRRPSPQWYELRRVFPARTLQVQRCHSLCPLPIAPPGALDALRVLSLSHRTCGLPGARRCGRARRCRAPARLARPAPASSRSCSRPAIASRCIGGPRSPATITTVHAMLDVALPLAKALLHDGSVHLGRRRGGASRLSRVQRPRVDGARRGRDPRPDPHRDGAVAGRRIVSARRVHGGDSHRPRRARRDRHWHRRNVGGVGGDRTARIQGVARPTAGCCWLAPVRRPPRSRGSCARSASARW